MTRALRASQTVCFCAVQGVLRVSEMGVVRRVWTRQTVIRRNVGGIWEIATYALQAVRLTQAL